MLKCLLNHYKDGVVSSGTFPGINLDDINSFSDGTDFSYAAQTQAFEAVTRELGVTDQKALQMLTTGAQALEVITRELGAENQKVSHLEQALTTKTQELEAMTRELGVANQKVSRLEQEQDSAQRELAAKTKELNGKNEKFLEASTHGKRQGNYASISFVLSGAFAVGASLTIPYLAICVTLAVAASIFLAVGYYCLYKANTALSNVEVDNCVSPAVVEV